jgi:hypothetical protein
LVRRPFKSGKNAGKRPYIAPEPIFDTRQAEVREACRLAVGADDQRGDLRFEAFDDMGQDRSAGKRQQAFIAATHTARFASGQDDADRMLAHFHA